MQQQRGLAVRHKLLSHRNVLDATFAPNGETTVFYVAGLEPADGVYTFAPPSAAYQAAPHIVRSHDEPQDD